MKPIILGESPNANGDRYYMFPLSGPIGQRLCTLAGITPDIERNSVRQVLLASYAAFRVVESAGAVLWSRRAGCGLPAD